MKRYWWVNQNQTYKVEISGGYMWSPKRNNNGAFNQFYNNMTLTRPGDLVFSFAGSEIRTVGEVTDAAMSVERPPEFGRAGDAWDEDGWLVAVEYEELSDPFRPKDYMDKLASLLPEKYSPIQTNGRGNQVYLAEISGEMADALLSIVGWQSETFTDVVHERGIGNRTDIGATEKRQLVNSRRGQGQYRKNLEKIEPGCRVTGVTDRRFLTASHIKPWSKSTDREKLDGNNGLLLAPHIDRLFDRGFISFEDDGRMIISPDLTETVLSAWGVKSDLQSRPLTSDQASYMSYHRAEVFKVS